MFCILGIDRSTLFIKFDHVGKYRKCLLHYAWFFKDGLSVINTVKQWVSDRTIGNPKAESP